MRNTLTRTLSVKTAPHPSPSPSRGEGKRERVLIYREGLMDNVISIADFGLRISD